MTTIDTTITAAELTTLKLYEIAAIIRKDWRKNGKSNVNFAAVPYLEALDALTNIEDEYGCDSGKSIVLYFLSNATTWRGDVAKLVKAELKKRAGIK